MVTPLDLQEQEQVDALKAFWRRYGGWITWVLVAALAAYAGWNGWQIYQQRQAAQAAAMFDELDRAAAAADVDKVSRVFADLRERYPGTAFAQQGGLVAAKALADKERLEPSRGALAWVAEHAVDPEIRAVAHIRLAGVLLDEKKFDEALRHLEPSKVSGFEALAADRRGDVLAALGRTAEAVAAYQAAWRDLPVAQDYRRVLEAKLAALGAPADAKVAPGGAVAPAAAGASR